MVLRGKPSIVGLDMRPGEPLRPRQPSAASFTDAQQGAHALLTQAPDTLFNPGETASAGEDSRALMARLSTSFIRGNHHHATHSS